MRTAAATAVLAIVGFASLSDAAVITYSDRTSWLGASTGVSTLDFEGIAPDGFYVLYPSPPGLTLGGVDFNVNAGTSL